MAFHFEHININLEQLFTILECRFNACSIPIGPAAECSIQMECIELLWIEIT